MSEVKKMKILDTNDLLPPRGEAIVRVHVKREYGKLLSFIFLKLPWLKTAIEKRLPEIIKDIDVSFIPTQVLIMVLTKVGQFAKLEEIQTKNNDIEDGLEETEKALKDLAEIIKLIFEVDFKEVTVEWILRNLDPRQMIGVMNYAINSFKETASKNAVAAQALIKTVNL